MFLSTVASVTLKNIIQKNFPEEYAERKQEHDSLVNVGADTLPLFVMDVVLPCQKFPLNIFEPRYRLMVSWSMDADDHLNLIMLLYILNVKVGDQFFIFCTYTYLSFFQVYAIQFLSFLKPSITLL